MTSKFREDMCRIIGHEWALLDHLVSICIRCNLATQGDKGATVTVTVKDLHFDDKT